MRKAIATHLLYLAVGLLSLVAAVFLSTKVVRQAKSQGVPPPALDPNVAQPAPANSTGAAPAESTKTVVQPVTEGAPATTEVGLPTEPAAENSVAAGAVMPGPESVSFLEPYIFDTREGRRNPFKPPLLADGTLPDVVLPGTPLERYDLGELKLVGIMWDVATPKAMVIDPQGEVHVLGKEDRIGRKRGYIAVIRESEVVVVESSDFNGESTYATRILRIE